MSSKRKRAKYDAHQLGLLLTRKTFTARELAAELRISKPTAYVWVRKLIASGAPVLVIKSPSKRTGPRAESFTVREG